jgi:hypothetical protein
VPTWGQILTELGQPENTLASGRPDFDGVRRRYLAALGDLTQRPTIVYSTGFLDRDFPSNMVSIELGDLQGFMNALSGLQGNQLDLVLTSPGGSAEATESIVGYLRTRFDHIRVFVPVAAMSAATMLCLGCDEIVMGKHSQLGPIDPQITVLTPEGPRGAPGQAILEQFERAKEECRKNPADLTAWIPILRGYLPGLLAMCTNQRELAKRMVRQWLEQYMFRGDKSAADMAERAAEWFADYEEFRSHGRRVSRDNARDLGIRITSLEDDQNLQDAVLSVHHCYSLTHGGTGAAKIIENSNGVAYVKLIKEVLLQAPPDPGQPIPSSPRSPNRAERRRQQRSR